MNVPLVSVVIPTHNRANMIGRAIESVLSQTYTNFEVIVVSDGSTDNTEKVVNSFSDHRIILLKHDESRGASAARNTGMRAARGKYIAFLDDDDEWTPNKLELQLPVITNSPPEVGLVYAWMDYVYKGNSIKFHAPRLRGDVFKEMLDKQAIGGCPTIIIKREVLDIVKGFDEELIYLNDCDFIRRVTKDFHVDFVPKVLALIQIGHRDRLSVSNPQRELKVIKALQKRLTLFEDDFKSHPRAWSNVLFQIARCHFKLGQLHNALSYIYKALKKNPFNISIYLSLPLAFGRRALRILNFRRKVTTSYAD